MPTHPEDTSQRDPLVHLMGAWSDGPSGYIEGMERDGQRQLVHSDVLPTGAPWDELAELGFVRGEKRDDLFTSATLPDGWKREGSDHAMWSYIVDTRGVRRVAIFYKAAFYDRSAHASIQNVGWSLGTEALYGDGPAELPASWDVLTDSERADFVDHVDDYLKSADEFPSIYKNADRARRLRELAVA